MEVLNKGGSILNDNCKQIKSQSGYNIELFLDSEQAQKYLCSICHHVVSDCHETDCGHIFCGGCIQRVLTSSDSDNYKCPFCGQRNLTSRPHKSIYLNRAVKTLGVKCPFYETGCKWTGCLSDLMIEGGGEQRGHLIKCQFAPIICDECNNKVCRAQYELHRKQCLKSCPNCNIMFTSINDRKLHYQQCPIMVLCPHCKQKIKKSELRHHISFLCSLREIKCPFYHFGCHEIIKSLNLTNHLKYNAAQHYQLKVDHCINKMEKMKLQIEQQNKRQNQLIKQNESLTKQLNEIINYNHNHNQNHSKLQQPPNNEPTKQDQNESLTKPLKNINNNDININNVNAPDILFLFGSNKWEETGVFIRRSHLHEHRVCYTSIRTKCAIRWNLQLNAWLIDRRGLANDNEASLIAYQNVLHPALVTTKWLVYNDDIEEWQQATNYKIKSYNLAEFIFKIDQIFASCSNHNLLNIDSKLATIYNDDNNQNQNHGHSHNHNSHRAPLLDKNTNNITSSASSASSSSTPNENRLPPGFNQKINSNNNKKWR